MAHLRSSTRSPDRDKLLALIPQPRSPQAGRGLRNFAITFSAVCFLQGHPSADQWPGNARDKGKAVSPSGSTPKNHGEASTESTLRQEEGTGQNYESCTDIVLVELVKNTMDVNQRGAILHELLIRESPYLPQIVVSELSLANDTEWRNCLIFLAEDMCVLEAPERRQLEQCLWQHASAIRRALSDRNHPALWSALRRLSTLIHEQDTHGFIDFLAEDNEHLTKQAALQAIQNVFSMTPPSGKFFQSDIQSSIRNISFQILDKKELSIEDEALLMQALSTMIVTGDAEANNLLERSLKRRIPFFADQLHDKLYPISKNWETHQPDQQYRFRKEILEKSLNLLTGNMKHEA